MGVRRQVVAVMAAAVGMVGLAVPHVGAQEPTDASIAKSTATWAEDDGGIATFTVTLTNLTDQPLGIDATVPSDAGCGVTTDPAELAANEPPTEVKVELGADCDTSAGKLVTQLTVGNATFEVSAVAEPSAPDTPWGQLRVFYVLLFASLVIVAVALLVLGRDRWWKPLAGLKADWDFKDAWATNVTALGAILTGVVGSSSVVKAILGEDAEQSIALATVGAAAAAAIAVAAPILLSVLKRDRSYTLLGVLVANALVVTAALGELWLVAWSGSRLERFGTGEDWALFVALGGAALLLVVYVVRNTYTVWVEGTTVKLKEPDVELLATALHLKYCCNVEEITAADFGAVEKNLKELLNLPETDDEVEDESGAAPAARRLTAIRPLAAARTVAPPDRGIGI